MSFWDSVQAGAKKAGDATKVAARKTKLHGDMMMIDRSIQNRKKAFGVSMYDHVSPLSQSADFYAATDDLTSMLRPALINAQKEIQALASKRVQLKESLATAEAKRAGAFPTKAETVGQKFMNFGKASVMQGGETKIKTELAMVDRQIKGYKQSFGLELYATLSEAEDTRGYLPTDRQVRNVYDTTRGDIQRLETNKKLKQEELDMLAAGGGSSSHLESPNNNSNGNGNGGSNPHDLTSDLSMQDSYFGNENPSGGGGGGGGYSDNYPSPNNQQQQLQHQQQDDDLLL
jgi:hypothetical protein